MFGDVFNNIYSTGASWLGYDQQPQITETVAKNTRIPSRKHRRQDSHDTPLSKRKVTFDTGHVEKKNVCKRIRWLVDQFLEFNEKHQIDKNQTLKGCMYVDENLTVASCKNWASELDEETILEAYDGNQTSYCYKNMMMLFKLINLKSEGDFDDFYREERVKKSISLLQEQKKEELQSLLLAHKKLNEIDGKLAYCENLKH